MTLIFFTHQYQYVMIWTVLQLGLRHLNLAIKFRHCNKSVCGAVRNETEQSENQHIWG